MTSRRTILKGATLVGTASLLKSQQSPPTRTQVGFNIAPGKSRHGGPMMLRENEPTTIKVSASDTGGQLVIFEGTISPGNGPRLHKHHDQDEWWYVLDGEFIFQIGEERFRAQPGTSVFGPRGVPHSYLSMGNTAGRMIIGFQPAGRMEEFFVEFARLSTLGPDAPLDSTPYGMENVGPRVTPDGVK